MNHPIENASNGAPADACPQDRASFVRTTLVGIAVGAAFNLLIVVWTWVQNDAGLAARAATALVMPIGLLWTLTLIACLVCFGQGFRRIGILFAMLFLFLSITGNGSVADASMSGIEWRRTDIETLPAPLRCVVVLGGGVGIAYDGVPELGMAGQRIMFTAQLWHAGKTQSVLCTGGSPLSPIPPAAAGRMLLESIAVPSDKIFESPGDNTSEEMKNLAAFFASPPTDFPSEGKIGLVTSASHMKRAMRLAAANGLSFIPLPCGFETSLDYDFSPRELIPGAGAMDSLGRSIKERLARIVKR